MKCCMGAVLFSNLMSFFPEKHEFPNPIQPTLLYSIIHAHLVSVWAPYWSVNTYTQRFQFFFSSPADTTDVVDLFRNELFLVSFHPVRNKHV